MVKIIHLNLKTIISICDIFSNYLGDGLNAIVKLILYLYRLTVPSFCGFTIEEQIEEIHRGIVVGIEPLITALLSDRQFINFVIREQARDSEFSSCLLKLFILQKLSTLSEETQDLWIKPSKAKQSLITSIFTTVEMCFSQFHLPVYLSGNLCQGKSQKMISFYELVCIRVCSFISAMPVQYFPILEKVLFNYVKSSGVYATLISDILCFVARYGSADLCFSYCSFLVELLMKSDAENNINMLHIRFLLRRIVKFLIPKYKCDLLDFIRNILSEYNDQVLEEQIKILLNWWKRLSLDQLSSSLVVKNITVKLIQIFTCLIPHLQNKLLLKTLDFLFQSWCVECDVVCAAIIQFLKQCKNKYVTPSAEQLKIFSSIARLFKYALQHPIPVLQYECIEAFAEFALNTPHAAIIPLCIKDDENLQKLVQQFLSKKIVRERVVDEKEMLSIFKTQFSNLRNKTFNDECLEEKSSFKINEMDNILITIESSVTKLELLGKQNLSEEVVNKLKWISMKIDDLCK
ncbi:uncharacterized protein C1orf112-like [Centruroides sculpturatus]|uniref:uncharacterized protein C1orf112-like n=1 Tax=Centruroides sculpturatus TaxID=218467 RepID=UPI000C6D6594|nr:uncharacterized protein C1orf112-like [Centruroides sculpturatus]